MSSISYENATIEELNVAIECLKRAGGPITDERVREWFSQLRQAAAEMNPVPDQPKVDVPPTERMRRKGRGWTTAPLEVELAKRKPRRKPVRNLEELQAAGQAEPAYRRSPGRKPAVYWWFEPVSDRMADGTPLKLALELEGVKLNARQIEAARKLKAFRAMYLAKRAFYAAQVHGKAFPDEKDEMLRKLIDYYKVRLRRNERLFHP